MKFFGLSLIALLAGSVIASPVPSDNAAAVSNAKQGAVADTIKELDTSLQAAIKAILSDAGLKKRGNVADVVKNLEAKIKEDLTTLLDTTDLTKRQDTSSIVADIDDLVSEIKEQYGVSKRGEVSSEVSALADQATRLIEELVDATGL